MRILIVEDDREAASYIRKGLRESGHVADHASDGEEGLEMARAADYDVLVVDRMMPRMDGLAMVETLRGEDDRTPVLILSALGEVDDRVEGLKAGGDDYLVKPMPLPNCLPASRRLPDAAIRKPCAPSWWSAIWKWTCSPEPWCATARRSCCNRGNSACSNS